MKYQSGFSNLDVKANASRLSWQQSTPLGNLVGMTQTSERLEDYNRQFSKSFAKYGIAGMQRPLKKGKTYAIVIHKQTNTVNVVTVDKK